MADSARRAEARAQRRKKAVGALTAIEDTIDEEDSKKKWMRPMRVPQRRVRGPAVPPLELDPGM